jgi:hypothetical protein
VLVQFDPDGKRLFQHRCNAKWTVTEKNLRVPGFLFEEDCLTLLRELPTSFEESSLTPVEQNAFDEIVMKKRFDGEEGTCIFEPDLTATLNGQPFGWQIEEDHEGSPVLILIYNNRRTCFLRKTAHGGWSGLWRYGDRNLLELNHG